DVGVGGGGGLCRHGRGGGTGGFHNDPAQPAVWGRAGKLDVRPAGVDADGADDLHRGVAHELVFLVGQRLRGGDRDGVAGVHAHRVEVLDRTHDDDVVLAVAHHLELELLPARDGLLDEDLADRRRAEPPDDVGPELLLRLREVAAGAAERAGGTQDGGQPDLGPYALGLLERVGDATPWQVEADAADRVLEEIAVLGPLDGVDLRADQLDAEAGQHPRLREVERAS